MADATYAQGGAYRDRDGNLKVPTGREIDIESGASLKIAGTAIAATAAELNTADLSAVEAIVPTATGATTGTIAGTGRITFCTVTSAGATDIVILPEPLPGRIVILQGNATGYELRSSAPATVAINGGTGASAESAIPASLTTIMICTSATTWLGLTYSATAAYVAVEAAA